jgi:hypothetical protein
VRRGSAPETQFLRNICEVFGDAAWLTTNDLLLGLHGREYITLSGKGLANRLRPYGIAPRHERFGGGTERGYWARDFAETFKRYLPVVPDVPDVPDADGQVEEEVEDVSEPARATGTSGTSGTSGTRE